MRGAWLAAIAITVGVLAGAPAQAATGCDPDRPAVVFRPGDATAHTQSGTQLIPCRYDTSARSLEPSMAFTNDGRALFQGWELQTGTPDGAPLRPVVMRSSADFTKWTDVSPPVGPLTSLDPYLAVDHTTGRIFSVNFLAEGVSGCSTVSTSDNDGATWTSSPAACGGFDGQSIGIGPPVTSTLLGYPNIVYYCTGNTPASAQPGTSPFCTKSLDGGRTYIPVGGSPYPPVDLASQDDEFGPWAGNPTVLADGTLLVPKRHAGQPEVSISHNEGLTWMRVKVAANGSSSQANRLALDGGGRLFYAWTAGDHLPYVAASTDGGKHWSAPLKVSPPGVNEAAVPWPAVSPSGRVMVAFIGTTRSPGAPYIAYCNYLLSPCDDGAYANVPWSGYMTVVDGLLGGHPELQTATVDPPGHPLFVGGCSADGACKADLDFINAQVGPDGSFFAAFVDDCALLRDFIPVFGQQFGKCSDNLGEGIVARLVGVTPVKQCVARRVVRIRVPRRYRKHARSFDVIVAGRTVARGRNPRRAARVVLRQHGSKAILVVLRIHRRGRRVVEVRRSYRFCAAG